MLLLLAQDPDLLRVLELALQPQRVWGLAMNKPIISVPTVDGLAYNLHGTDKLMCPIMDARRDQVYTGLYEFIGDKLSIISSQKAVSIDEIIDEINKIGRETVFLG